MINQEELEKILLANWTKFINPQKFIAFILLNARNAEFPIVEAPDTPNKTKVTLSKFYPSKDGFLIWADFSVPRNDGTALGTCEITFNHVKGELTHLRTVGTLLKKT